MITAAALLSGMAAAYGCDGVRLTIEPVAATVRHSEAVQIKVTVLRDPVSSGTCYLVHRVLPGAEPHAETYPVLNLKVFGPEGQEMPAQPRMFTIPIAADPDYYKPLLPGQSFGDVIDLKREDIGFRFPVIGRYRVVASLWSNPLRWIRQAGRHHRLRRIPDEGFFHGTTAEVATTIDVTE
jgi:hypothetical protein